MVWMKGVSFPRRRQCAHLAKHKEDGKDWCGTHLPSRVKAKQIEERARWSEEWKAKQAALEYASALLAAREAVIQAAKVWYVADVSQEAASRALGDAVLQLHQLEADNGTD